MLVLFFTLIVNIILCGQAQPQISKDDSTTDIPRSYSAPLLLASPIRSLPFAISTAPANYPEYLHLKFGSSSNALNSIIEQNLDVSEIWKIGKLREDELKTLRSILGSVQLGGVAYLAYRHIKKYGLK